MNLSIVKDKDNILFTAVSFSLSLMVFSWFIQYRSPIKFIAIASLLFTAFIISRNLKNMKQFTGTLKTAKAAYLLAGTGIMTGMVLAFIYRDYLQQSLIPSSLHFFALTAALIGSMEELLFRGFLQDSTRPAGNTFSIIYSTASHTGYKCFLFISPAAEMEIDFEFLVLWTFMVGLVFAITKHFTNSVLPALTAHAVFDIMVYGSLTTAPWWVW